MPAGMRFDVAPFKEAMVTMNRDSRRAAMWATRDSARAVKRQARKIAPVYSGERSHAKVTTGKRDAKGAGKREYGNSVEIVPGAYRDSIASSKRFTAIGSELWLKLGPRGGHVHLYAGKIEKLYGVMGKAFGAVAPTVSDRYDAAMARVLARYR